MIPFFLKNKPYIIIQDFIERANIFLENISLILFPFRVIMEKTA